MILINLLPHEFRRETLSRRAFLPDRKLTRMGGILFLVLTGILYLQYLVGLGTLKGLQGRWVTIQQELQRTDQLKAQMEKGGKGERDFLENYVFSPYPTTLILSAVSQSLPTALWLVEMKVIRQPHANTLILKGVSRSSREQSSVQQIENYLRDLKDQFPADADLALTTSRQQKERMELTLFTAVFKWTQARLTKTQNA